MKLTIVFIENENNQLNETAIASVLNQSLKEVEVICVYHKGADILGEQFKADSRIKWIESNSDYIGALYNIGLANAKGDYIHFFGNFAKVLDYAYESLINKAIKYNTDVLRFQSVVYDSKEGIYRNYSEYLLNELGPGDYHRSVTLTKDTLLYESNINHDAWTGIYRTEFLRSNGILFDESVSFMDLSFYYKTLLLSSNTMFSMDRVVVKNSNTMLNIKKVYKNYSKDILQALGKIENMFLAAEMEPVLIMKIMNQELSRYVTECLKKFKVLPGKSEEEQLQENAWILDSTEKIVASYQGMFQTQLMKHFYENLRFIIKKTKDENKLPEKYSLYHKKCAKPSITVVVPTMNVEDYLNLALSSLSYQTMEELEFICLNDGSTDHSLVIMKEYAALDERIQIIDKPNSGYGNTMNQGIDLARGEYLAILEPDDFLPKNMLKNLYKVASQNDVDFVKADFYRFVVKEDGTLGKKRNSLSKDPSYYNRLVDPSMELESFNFIMNTWSGIYKLQFLNKYHIRHNETPGASFQDNGFWFQTFCRAKRAWFVKEPYYMNRRDNPNSSVYSKKKEYCITEEYKYIWNWMSSVPGYTERFSGVFFRKKLGNFMTTYRRLDPELKKEYIYHICDEFGPAVESGAFTSDDTDANTWKQLTEMLSSPDTYLDSVRVSVIIPVYNAEKYICQCLDSVLFSTALKIEVICVDDGSTDSSLTILREYEKKDNRVKVITQENQGAGAARNNGLKHAVGEYLSFLDADDFFELNMLQTAYNRASLNGDDIIVFGADEFHDLTNSYCPSPFTINEKLIPDINSQFSMADVKYNRFKVFVGWAWDKLFKREFVLKHQLQFQEQRTTNDMLFVFSALVKAEKISVFKAVLAHHRKTTDTLSVTREKSWDCFYHALVALKEVLVKDGLYEMYEQDYINYCQHFTLWNLESLSGASYFKLYDRLQEEWLDGFGIFSHGIEYFYDWDEYQRMCEVKNSTAQEYLFSMLEKSKAAAKIRKKSSGNQKKNLKESLKEKEQEIKSTVTWKVGQTVLFVPKKLKKMISGKK